MPAIRRQAAIRRASFDSLTPDQDRDLLHGQTFFRGKFTDLESFTEAWLIHRDRLMAKFRIPGHRPYAWWVVEHQQERPVLGDASRADQFRNTCRFNFVHTSHWESDEIGYFQMPEPDYLKQWGLLSPEEIERVEWSAGLNNWGGPSLRRHREIQARKADRQCATAFSNDP